MLKHIEIYLEIPIPAIGSGKSYRRSAVGKITKVYQKFGFWIPEWLPIYRKQKGPPKICWWQNGFMRPKSEKGQSQAGLKGPKGPHQEYTSLQIYI